MLFLTKSPRVEATPVFTAAPAGAEPSRLLVHVAGDFAGDIAQVWPDPHAPFLLADAARRHLVCLALTLAEPLSVRPGPGFVRPALEGSLRVAVRTLLPGAPSGLPRVLGRLGEVSWAAGDYRLLLARLAEPHAAKVLRHAERVTPADVRVLSALPDALLAEGGMLLRLTEDQGRLVARCHAGVLLRDGPDRAAVLAHEWAGAATPKVLFERVMRDIELAQVQPFHPGTERLRPLASRAALKEASRRYHNCLDGRLLDGNSHYYEWRGPPGVVVCVTADALWGWALTEGRLARNETVPPEIQRAIAADLETMGVHVGRNLWGLRWACESALDDDFTFGPSEKEVAIAFDG